MHAVFVACLVGGAVGTALLVLLGAVGAHGFGHGTHVHAGAHGGHTGLHAHGHAGHAGTSHGHAAHGHGHAAHAEPQAATGSANHWMANAAGWGASWLSPLTLMAAALWFGGAGLIFEGNPFVLLLAVVAAIIGASVIRTMMGAFFRASSAPLELGADGALATVNATIRPNAPGEVVYTLEGLHRSLPARSEDGKTIPRGTEVIITRREGGFAWVEPLNVLEELGTEEETAPR